MRRVVSLTAAAILLAGCSAEPASQTETPQVEKPQVEKPQASSTVEPTGSTAAGDYRTETLPDGREFIVHVPTSIEWTKPVPLIVGFHGWKETDTFLFEDTNLHEAEAVTIFTKGVGNAWAPAPYAQTSVEEDLAYTDAVLKWARENFNVGETYALGMSNGGGFTQLLSCQRPDEFGAFVTVSAAYYDGVLDNCSDKPVKRLDMHGTADGVMAYEGGERHGAHFRGARDVMDEFAKRNKCHGVDSSTDGAVETFTWKGCEQPTVHMKIEGGQHVWNGGAHDHNAVVGTDFATLTALEFIGIGHNAA